MGRLVYRKISQIYPTGCIAAFFITQKISPKLQKITWMAHHAKPVPGRQRECRLHGNVQSPIQQQIGCAGDQGMQFA